MVWMLQASFISISWGSPWPTPVPSPRASPEQRGSSCNRGTAGRASVEQGAAAPIRGKPGEAVCRQDLNKGAGDLVTEKSLQHCHFLP